MDRYEQAAVLSQLIAGMRAKDSWTGETHVQKTTYFLQELLKVPLGFNFILYKHGPFSFDLRDALSTMRADELLEIQAQSYPYGPRLAPSSLAEGFKAHYSNLLRDYERKIAFIVERLGKSTVSELERFATAFYVTINGTASNLRAQEVNRLKPHVSIAEAGNAVEFVDALTLQAQTFH